MACEGQPFLVQTRRTVTIILANPSVFGLIIGASQHARTEPPHRSRQASPRRPRRPRCPRAAARRARLLRNPRARIDC